MQMTRRRTTGCRRPRAAARWAILPVAVLFSVSGCGTGDVEIGDGQRHRGDITVAVGTVEIGSECIVEGGVSLQAGNVDVGDRTLIEGPVQVKHGNVVLQEDVQVPAVTVTSGTIELGRGAVVTGPLRLTSGLVKIAGARVGGQVQIVRGRLEVDRGSVLEMGLRAVNPGSSLRDSTYVVIKSGARVAGTVEVSGSARLIVEPGADTSEADFTGFAPESGS